MVDSDHLSCSFVTGGASGVGRSICDVLASHGPVAVVDRDLAGAIETAEAIERDGGKAFAFQCDVTVGAELNAAVESYQANVGRMDIAVACAGVGHAGTVLDEPEDAWDEVLNINAKGVYLTARAVFPTFVAHGGGSFVAIASAAGVVGARQCGIYCASKHAVVGLVRALALDFGGVGIRSNVVCPGAVRTPMFDAHVAAGSSEEAEYYRTVVPSGRYAEPEEVARVVEFLASPSASYMNGSVYMVDGGASVDLVRY